MATPNHHYYHSQFRDHLRAAGHCAVAERLEETEQDVAAARKARNDAHDEALRIYYESIKPFLRPCHARQGLDLRTTPW